MPPSEAQHMGREKFEGDQPSCSVWHYRESSALGTVGQLSPYVVLRVGRASAQG
jgi:hypothetical protein